MLVLYREWYSSTTNPPTSNLDKNKHRQAQPHTTYHLPLTNCHLTLRAAYYLPPNSYDLQPTIYHLPPNTQQLTNISIFSFGAFDQALPACYVILNDKLVK